MHHKLEAALRELKQAREARNLVVKAFGELEKAHGADSIEANRHDKFSVDPAHKAVSEAEAALIAAPSLSARDVLAKVAALLDDGDMPIGAMETLTQEAKRFTGSEEQSSQPQTAQERIALIAESVSTKAPQNLISSDGGPSKELLEFCHKTGASLDFIFSGDVTSMIRQLHSAEQRSQRNDAVSRLYQLNALIRCAMAAEENQTSGLEWKGVAEVLEVAEDVLGEAIEAVEQMKTSRPTLVAAE